MDKEELKKEIHSLIDNTDDEALLHIVKEDIVAYQTETNKNFDDLSYLTPEERKDLEQLATEDSDKDTVSFEEYQKGDERMVLEIEVKKRFIQSMKRVNSYLLKEWSIKVAEEFTRITDDKIKLLAHRPDIGIISAIKNTRSILVGKGYQNRLYYRVEKNKLIILNLKDVRKNPKKNRFHQP